MFCGVMRSGQVPLLGSRNLKEINDAARTRAAMAANIAALVALVLSLAAGLYLVFLPAYSGVSTYQDTAGLVQTTITSATLIEANGWSVLVPILVPVVVCIGAFALRHTAAARMARMGAAILLATFVVLTGFSVGLFYLPATLAMVIAALAKPDLTSRGLTNG